MSDDIFPAIEEEISTVSSLFDDAKKKLENEKEQLEELRDEVNSEKKKLQQKLESFGHDIDEDVLNDFIDRPYTIIKRDKNEAVVVVPKWFPFTVGWLEKQDGAYNHFVVNKYVNWIEEVPDEIKEEVDIQPKYSKVERIDTDILEFNSEAEREMFWNDMGGRSGGLYARRDDDKVQIQDGSEFEVISELVENGNLPFSKSPISKSSLRSDPSNVALRDWQERAWEKFLEYGNIGIYWPPGAGKTFLSLYIGERLDGDKLVVVPKKTLKEQWKERIDEFCSSPSEWRIETYQYLTYGDDNLDEVNDDGVTLTIFDEHHTIASNYHSKLSTIDTDHRIGLSASPYRNDGRESYIYALTGHPVGLNWDELIEIGAVKRPDTKTFLHRTQKQKTQSLVDLLEKRTTGKTIIFCDSIDKGKKLSDKLDVPFVHGETKDRMAKFRENRVVISSRVGDEGVSLPDIQTVIEYDFHGSSRRQELQRAGRLMHNSDDADSINHYVLMTDDEHEKFSDRLLSLEQRGFKIETIRRE